MLMMRNLGFMQNNLKADRVKIITLSSMTLGLQIKGQEYQG